MKYNSLSNDSDIRRRVTYPYAWIDQQFSEDQLKELEQICSNKVLSLGITGDGTLLKEDIERIRRSKIAFINKDDNNSFIFEQFNSIIENLNNQFYGFDLNGYNSFQYTVYNSGNKGMYDWHNDVFFGENIDDNMWKGDTRKLTMVMLLSNSEDFTGGEFQIHEGREEASYTIPMYRGKIIVFPSFISHRVTPILSGERKSIVIWVEGPKFR